MAKKRVQVQVEVTAYSSPDDDAHTETEDIVRRALDLQNFVNFLHDDITQAITSIEPTALWMPQMLDHHDNAVMYEALAYALGDSSEIYRYTFLIDLLPQQQAEPVTARRVLLGDILMDPEPSTPLPENLNVMVERDIPGIVGDTGVYEIKDPSRRRGSGEVWLTGKLKKDHLRAFYQPYLRYGAASGTGSNKMRNIWLDVVDSRFPAALHEVIQATLERGDDFEEAPMVVLELLHDHLGAARGSSFLAHLIDDVMLNGKVVEEAYVRFKDKPWTSLSTGVYRRMYDIPEVIDSMIEFLTHWYVYRMYNMYPEEDMEFVEELAPTMEFVTYALIDAIAPLIGDWRLVSFAATVSRFLNFKFSEDHGVEKIKEYATFGEGIQSLAENPEYVVIRFEDRSTYTHMHFFLRPEDTVPRMSLKKVERLR